MTNEELLRRFSSLPPEGQRQAADFIAFLQERYGEHRFPESPPATGLSEEGFIGMWRDREDLRNSGAWVRRAREREWA